MRKFIVLLLLLTGCIGLQAALPDAFKDIYPPTDKKVMKSLNGTWHLKVIRGVNHDPRVPERDATWGTEGFQGRRAATGHARLQPLQRF